MSEVMLATKARDAELGTLRAADWHFSVKLDGFRGLLKPGRLLSRNGTDLSSWFPEIVEHSPAGWTLDAEVILADRRGVPTVYELQRRWANHRYRTGQARLAVFDVLRSPHDGAVTDWPLRDRLQLLDHVPYNDTILRMPDGPDGPELFQIAVASGAEGVVAKWRASRYRVGRSRWWLKFKRSDRVTCLAIGWVPGGDQPPGVALLRTTGDRLQHVGVVRYGFTAAERRRVRDLLQARRQLLLDVDCQEITPNGQLRFPVFAGVREDLTLADL